MGQGREMKEGEDLYGVLVRRRYGVRNGVADVEFRWLIQDDEGSGLDWGEGTIVAIIINLGTPYSR